MNNKHDPTELDDSDVSEFLHQIAPRPQPPADMRDTVRRAVHNEWRQDVARRKQRSVTSWAMGLAASVLCAVVLWQTSTPEVALVAGVQVGEVEWSDNQVEWQTLARGVEIRPGFLRSSDSGSFAIDLDVGTSLRVDKGSLLELRTSHQLRLLNGRIYVDTGDNSVSSRQIEVLTDHGIVRDIGTRFMVEAVDRNSISVTVRDGLVETDTGDQVHRIPAHTRLSFDETGAAAPIDVSAHDVAWQWTREVAPVPTVEGQNTLKVLQWLAREKGLKLEFSSGMSQVSAGQGTLHGQFENLDFDEIMDVVLTTSELTVLPSEPGILLIDIRR